MSSTFIDTNILLYSIDVRDTRKQIIAANLIDTEPFICAQNISELINVLLNKWKYPKQNLEIIIGEILDSCYLANTSQVTYKKAFGLIKRYNLQIFDAIIVSAALDAGCSVLYTEDMQHGLVVEKKLKIQNPFLNQQYLPLTK
ncbi:PIN domain-containing protein [Parasediminibacterium sp. JCM 36343]|uniref:PIN domain-containing protein n=1 Tax=Parasediminibacterium sp. JCM 36343 TaxID=3374279 RepID=UPI00397CBDCE